MQTSTPSSTRSCSCWRSRRKGCGRPPSRWSSAGSGLRRPDRGEDSAALGGGGGGWTEAGVVVDPGGVAVRCFGATTKWTSADPARGTGVAVRIASALRGGGWTGGSRRAAYWCKSLYMRSSILLARTHHIYRDLSSPHPPPSSALRFAIRVAPAHVQGCK